MRGGGLRHGGIRRDRAVEAVQAGGAAAGGGDPEGDRGDEAEASQNRAEMTHGTASGWDGGKTTDSLVGRRPAVSLQARIAAATVAAIRSGDGFAV